MSIRNYITLNVKNLIALALVGWGSSFAMQQSAVAGGEIVAVENPVSNNCHVGDPCAGHSFCYKLRLHCVYCRRALTQRYILLPTNPTIAPYDCPPPNAGQPTIGGYGPPPQVSPPAGVFIR